jgi:uncharacterized membrane protein
MSFKIDLINALLVLLMSFVAIFILRWIVAFVNWWWQKIIDEKAKLKKYEEERAEQEDEEVEERQSFRKKTVNTKKFR